MIHAAQKTFLYIGRSPSSIVFILLFACGHLWGWQIPWTDDARFYVPAAQAYAEWTIETITNLLGFDIGNLSRSAVDQSFSFNHEHPPIAKYIMGMTWFVFYRILDWCSPIGACRIGISLLWALTGALVFNILHNRHRFISALFAALAFATMPRVFFHGHVATLDLAASAMVVLSFYYFAQSLSRPTIGNFLIAWLAFALALGCKLIATFFLVGALVFWIINNPPQWNRKFVQCQDIPIVIIGFILVSPVVLFLFWPWLWFDSFERIIEYIGFHSRHYGILFYFRGVLYEHNFAPWYAPWYMIVITTPIPFLGLALYQIFRLIKPIFSGTNWRIFFSPQCLSTQKKRRTLDVFSSLTLALFSLILIAVFTLPFSLPNVPVYGGVKLFLPVFPFIAILAGITFDQVLTEISNTARSSHIRLAVKVSVFLLLILPALLGIILYHRAPLSYYNTLVGGLRGAVARGFERQYYDMAYPEIRNVLAQHLPEGGGVAFLPNPKEYHYYINQWKQSGTLSPMLRLTSPSEAQLLVLSHERRWKQYPEQLSKYRTRPLLFRFSIADVPLFSVYDLR